MAHNQIKLIDLGIYMRQDLPVQQKLRDNSKKLWPVESKQIPAVSVLLKLRDTIIPIPPGFPEGGELVNKIIMRRWEIGLDWVLVKQTEAFTSVDHRFASRGYKNYKAFGCYLNAKLELCYALFDFLKENNSFLPYESFVDLFAALVIEERLGELTGECPDNKQEDLKLRRAQLKALKARANPYDDAIPSWINHFIFFEAVLCAAKHNPKENNLMKRKRKNFREGPLSNYEHETTKWISHLENMKYGELDPSTGAFVRKTKRAKNKPAKETVWPLPSKPQRSRGRQKVIKA